MSGTQTLSSNGYELVSMHINGAQLDLSPVSRSGDVVVVQTGCYTFSGEQATLSLRCISRHDPVQDDVHVVKIDQALINGSLRGVCQSTLEPHSVTEAKGQLDGTETQAHRTKMIRFRVTFGSYQSVIQHLVKSFMLDVFVTLGQQSVTLAPNSLDVVAQNITVEPLLSSSSSDLLEDFDSSREFVVRPAPPPPTPDEHNPLPMSNTLGSNPAPAQLRQLVEGLVRAQTNRLQNDHLASAKAYQAAIEAEKSHKKYYFNVGLLSLAPKVSANVESQLSSHLYDLLAPEDKIAYCRQRLATEKLAVGARLSIATELESLERLWMEQKQNIMRQELNHLADYVKTKL